MAEAFNQHPGVPLKLIKAIVMGIEPLLDPRKALIDQIEATIVTIEPSLNPIKSLIERLKPSVQVLNEFLIHPASAAREG